MAMEPDIEIKVPETGRSPQGIKALYKLDKDGKSKIPLADQDVVRLVNVSLVDVHVRVPDSSFKAKDGKVQETQVPIPRFGYLDMPALYALKNLQCQEKPKAPTRLVVAPRDGDCQGKDSFTAHKRKWSTCDYGNCKFHGELPTDPRPIYWSIWQAQHFIGYLKSAEAIQMFVERYDLRMPVVQWGLRVIAVRAEALAARMGMNKTHSPGEITF